MPGRGSDSGKPIFELVVEPTHLKDMRVKIGSFPRIGRDENKIWFKPPPSFVFSNYPFGAPRFDNKVSLQVAQQ